MTAIYHTRAADKFFYAMYSLVENEIDLSSTVTMINIVDVSAIEKIRQSYSAHAPTYTAFVAKALAQTLVEMPFCNRRFYRPFGLFPRRFQEFSEVDIGIASELTDPKFAHASYIDVMTGVQNRSLSDIQNWLHQYRDNSSVKQWQIFRQLIESLPRLLARFILRLPVYFPSLWVKYRGGAAIISSPGKYGVDQIVAAWSSPIGVSYGLVKDRPVVREQKLVITPTFFLTLNFDRRLMSGAQGARLISRMTQILENGENWSL